MSSRKLDERATGILGLALALCVLADASAQPPPPPPPPQVTTTSPVTVGATVSTEHWVSNDRDAVVYPLVVTQVGTIIVTVVAQGTPVAVTLSHPGELTPARPVIGTGTMQLRYPVQPADAQHPGQWQLRIAVTQSPGQATGTLSIQQPPADAQATTMLHRAINAKRLPTGP